MGFWSSIFQPPKTPVQPTTTAADPVLLASLRLQVFSEDYYAMRVIDRTAVALRPLAPGLIEAIVADIGNGAAETTVQWKALRSLGKTDDEMFEFARTQAAATETAISTQKIEFVQVMVSNGFYLSAAMLHTFASWRSGASSGARSGANQQLPHGALVVPLSWHHWCVHAISEGFTVAPSLAMLELVAEHVGSAIQVTDAERLGNRMYWIKPGGRIIDRVELVGAGTDRGPSPGSELGRLLTWQ